MYDGSVLVQKDNFRYLGLLFTETDWVSQAPVRLAESATKAMFAVICKCEAMQITCLKVKLAMFMTMVASVGNYGCQLWAVNYLDMSRESAVFDNPFQEVVFDFLRKIGKTYRNTSKWVLLEEFGLLPCQAFWAKLCARFWNKNTAVVQAPKLLKGVFTQDICLFQKGNTDCWCFKFLSCMFQIDMIACMSMEALKSWSSQDLMDLKFPEEEVAEKMFAYYARWWGDFEMNPRSAPSKGVSLVKHRQWFYDKDLPHLSMVESRHHTLMSHPNTALTDRVVIAAVIMAVTLSCLVAPLRRGI